MLETNLVVAMCLRMVIPESNMLMMFVETSWADNFFPSKTTLFGMKVTPQVTETVRRL